jgi:hypothetical protein
VRQPGEQPRAPRQGPAGPALSQGLGAQRGHVDAVRAFALAAFAGHAQVHRGVQRAVGKGSLAEAAVQGFAQHGGTAARAVQVILADAKARAHQALVAGLASGLRHWRLPMHNAAVLPKPAPWVGSAA